MNTQEYFENEGHHIREDAHDPPVTQTEDEHICEHEGCQSRDTILCRVVDYSVTVEEQHPEDTYWYCAEHCQVEGFCSGCGMFCAGMESFDFRQNGLCDYCNDELESELADSDDSEDFVY